MFWSRESLAAIKKSLQLQPDIIEVDVRKSTDGILFCYHGTPLQFLFPQFYFKKSLGELQRHYPSITTLSEITTLVADQCILFIDVKDPHITYAEIHEILKNFNRVYIASQNLHFLKKLPPLPQGWKKICNGGVFFLRRNLKQLRELNLDVIELFWWDYTAKNIKTLNDNNVEVALAAWLFPRRSYLKKSFAKNSLWVWDYDLPKIQCQLCLKN